MNTSIQAYEGIGAQNMHTNMQIKTKKTYKHAWKKMDLMQRRRIEAESVTHNYYNSSTKPKFYKNTRLAGKIIDKTSITNFY